MTLAVVGMGRVGVTLAACLADMGSVVAAADCDGARIADLACGRVAGNEPGLQGLVEVNLRKARLSFSSAVPEVVSGSHTVFLTVEPELAPDGTFDCNALFATAREIAEGLNDFTLVILSSTVPVGTGDRVEALIRTCRPDARFAVVSCPLFLRRGAAITDMMRPDRIVIGVSDSRARRMMGEIWRPMCRDGVPLVYTSRRSAEMVSYASNAFLAMKRAFLNEMDSLCAVTGASLADIGRAVDLDRRIGTTLLGAGSGADNAEFSKELLALIRMVGDLPPAAGGSVPDAQRRAAG